MLFKKGEKEMATRGCIARKVNDGFRGVYHHWDSYPEGLGKALWELYHGYFKRDLRQMLKILIDEHQAGWSSIVNADFNLPIGWIGDLGRKIISEGGTIISSKNPVCYCHGDRCEAPNILTEKTASSIGVEWVYAFDVNNNAMYILASYNEDGSKMIGAWGFGNPEAEWRTVAIIDLHGKEPNWEEIYKRALS